MPLRKALLSATVLQDNSASFTNLTNDRLHIRKVVMKALSGVATQIGDAASASLDEVPVDQSIVNDSRSHIASVLAVNTGGTGALISDGDGQTLSFNRGDLVLDPDEALFLNLNDIVGAPPVRFNANFWYEA